MLYGRIRATEYPNNINPQVICNQENLQFVKNHFLQQKNHIFFVKQGMKTFVISFNQTHFGLFFMKKLSRNYERLRISVYICYLQNSLYNTVHICFSPFLGPIHRYRSILGNFRERG